MNITKMVFPNKFEESSGKGGCVLRWRASNVTQPCNNWRRGFRFTALSAPAKAVEAIHDVMPPVLFQGFSWASIDHVTC